MLSLAQDAIRHPNILTVGPFYRNKTQILSELSLPYQPGQWIALIGRSGIGKTTFLRCLAGLEPESIPRHNLKVSYIPQKDTLLPWKTVAENIGLAHVLKGKKIDHLKVAYYLQLTALQDYQDYFPHQLSQGMRQRVAIARALFEDADLILMDEPFSALDGLTRAELNQAIKPLLTGKTIILVTHDVHEACTLAHDIYILKNRPGILVHLGHNTPQHLLKALSA
jgi:putative hydroxymethylpyrimidine transport system ATP-binding protein